MSYDELRLASGDDLDRLDEYALVVIDEAPQPAQPRHRPGRRGPTGSSRAPTPKQLVLMTATPVNNSLLDLHTLVGYFVKNDAAFASRGHPEPLPVHPGGAGPGPGDAVAGAPVRAPRRGRRAANAGLRQAPLRGLDDPQPGWPGHPDRVPDPACRAHRLRRSMPPATNLLERVIAALEPDDSDVGERWRPDRQPMHPADSTLARYMPSRYAIADHVEAVPGRDAGLRAGRLPSDSSRARKRVGERLVS